MVVHNNNVVISIDDKVNIADNVILGPRCKKFTVKYGSILHRDLYINVEELTIGEFTTIHHGSILNGLKTNIGHNCWIGHYTTIDSVGGLADIKNNVIIGTNSQLWTHMKGGDTLEGCLWNSSGNIVIEDDVWLNSHSILGPIHAQKKSMLMSGSLITKNMESNKIYGGTPAVDLTHKLGNQFRNISLEEKYKKFIKLREDFCKLENINIGVFTELNFEKPTEITKTLFSLKNRTYYPVRSEIEYKFIKFMLYDKAKWIPQYD